MKFGGHQSAEILVAIWPYAHDPLDAAIKCLTRGYGTHAAFVRGNGKIIESFWPCVRERNWKPHEGKRVELYRVDGTTPADWNRLERWFDAQLAKPVPPKWLCIVMQIPIVSRWFAAQASNYRTIYSVRDLFRFAFDLPPVSTGECFCSMWDLRALRINLADTKQPLVRLEYQDFASPRDLRISPMLKPVHVQGMT